MVRINIKKRIHYQVDVNICFSFIIFFFLAAEQHRFLGNLFLLSVTFHFFPAALLKYI